MEVQEISLKNILDRIMREIGILSKDEKSEVIAEFTTGDYIYYIPIKFKINYLETLEMGKVPKSIEKFIDTIQKSFVYNGIVIENTQLKQELERLKPFETYYNMQMELNKANKS